MTVSEIATVLAWHDALNDRNLGTLSALSSDDIKIADADGAAQGHVALQEWAGSVRGTVEVGRVYEHDGVVVAEQLLPDARMASAFRVVEDRVTSVFRHDDLAAALAAVDLGEDDLHTG